MPPCVRTVPRSSSAMRSMRSSSARSWLTSSRQPRNSSSAPRSERRASRSRLLVGSSSSSTSGRFSSWAARPRVTAWPPLSVPMRRSRGRPPRPSRSSWARVRSSMSQFSPMVVKCSSLVSPDSMASRARITGAMPRTSATVRPGVRRRVCGRWPSTPPTVTVPLPGRYSPAISFSSVLLPAPLGATRPVRPPWTVKDRSWMTGVSSGQENERFEQVMNASDMRGDLGLRGGRAHGAPAGGRQWRERRNGHGGGAPGRLPVAGQLRVSPGDVVVTRHVWSPRSSFPASPVGGTRRPMVVRWRAGRGGTGRGGGCGGAAVSRGRRKGAVRRRGGRLRSFSG